MTPAQAGGQTPAKPQAVFKGACVPPTALAAAGVQASLPPARAPTPGLHSFAQVGVEGRIRKGAPEHVPNPAASSRDPASWTAGTRRCSPSVPAQSSCPCFYSLSPVQAEPLCPPHIGSPVSCAFLHIQGTFPLPCVHSLCGGEHLTGPGGPRTEGVSLCDSSKLEGDRKFWSDVLPQTNGLRQMGV